MEETHIRTNKVFYDVRHRLKKALRINLNSILVFTVNFYISVESKSNADILPIGLWCGMTKEAVR